MAYKHQILLLFTAAEIFLYVQNDNYYKLPVKIFILYAKNYCCLFNGGKENKWHKIVFFNYKQPNIAIIDNTIAIYKKSCL